MMRHELIVESEPPGAKIEINGEYLGTAPGSLGFDGWPDRTIPNWPHGTTIKALPSESGYYTQIMWFYPSGGPVTGKPIPKRIFFDMRLKSVQPAMDVNVYNR